MSGGGYGGTGKAQLIRNNEQIFLFQQDGPGLAGRASIALQLERINRSYYPWGASFQLYFTDANGAPADPGAFEIDIQTSDIDQELQYSSISAWSGASSLNANFVGRIELPTFYAKYIRALIVNITNPVFVTLLATH